MVHTAPKPFPSWSSFNFFPLMIFILDGKSNDFSACVLLPYCRYKLMLRQPDPYQRQNQLFVTIVNL
jgi:hypothetical protein